VPTTTTNICCASNINVPICKCDKFFTSQIKISDPDILSDAILLGTGVGMTRLQIRKLRTLLSQQRPGMRGRQPSMESWLKVSPDKDVKRSNPASPANMNTWTPSSPISATSSVRSDEEARGRQEGDGSGDGGGEGDQEQPPESADRLLGRLLSIDMLGTLGSQL
jgi:hypothetical protein